MRASKKAIDPDLACKLLPEALGVPGAFPWQERLLLQLIEGKLPAALDLPTGLGKTSIMAIWLLAKAAGAELPNRLVYVVDRRAVVDQATDVAERLHEFVKDKGSVREALGLQDEGLPVSTLRGQHADNREWLKDPSVPAIIVGTVDMVGSRLLFSGYGVSRKMRPYQAGLLGADALFVLDESHLVPPFERLLEAVADARARGFGPSEAKASQIPSLRTISLSATGKSGEQAFQLSEEDRRHPEVRKRLQAGKSLQLKSAVARKDLAGHIDEIAWGMVNQGDPRRLVVYVNSRQDAERIFDRLHARLLKEKKGEEPPIELFVGGRRVHERQEAATWLLEHGFMGAKRATQKSAILVATSAAEVGVDLDADSAVMDLVPWQRMVQRLGRINRRGDKGTAPVVIIPVEREESKKKKKNRMEREQERREDRLEACAALIKELPAANEGVDGCPAALGKLRDRLSSDPASLLVKASDPDPLHPALQRPHVEAWAMTSLPSHPGRPEVRPWLRGWKDFDEARETTVVFRYDLPILRSPNDWRPFDDAAMEDFLEAAGPHSSERLELEPQLVESWLRKRIEALRRSSLKSSKEDWEREPFAVLVRGTQVRSFSLAEPPPRWLTSQLSGAVLFVSPRLGGLRKGLLDPNVPPARGRDEGWDLTKADLPEIPFRIRRSGEFKKVDEDFLPEHGFVTELDAEGEPVAFLIVERRASSPPGSEAGRSVTRRSQTLEAHQEWVYTEAKRLAVRLELDERLAQALQVAARLHDEGKRVDRWQRAFRVAEKDRPLAKSTFAPLRTVLGSYRHELGSLPRMRNHPDFVALDDEMKELALHLVAAHHGRARPVLPTEDAEGPPTRLRREAQEVALRFHRLSELYGPWGLAWLEALLRAADQRASAKLDRGEHHG